MPVKSFKDVEREYLDIHYKYANHLEVNGQFDQWVNIYDRTYHSIMPIDKGVRILDIGCGAGHFLYYLREQGYTNFTGVDSCHQMVKYVHQYVTPYVLMSDAFEFLARVKPNSVDMIVANDFIEHMPKEQALRFVGLCCDALKPGGRLALKTMNMSAYGANVILYNDLTHWAGYTEESLTMLFRLYGFREIAILPVKDFITARLTQMFMSFFYRLACHPTIKVPIMSRMMVGTGVKA